VKIDKKVIKLISFSRISLTFLYFNPLKVMAILDTGTSKNFYVLMKRICSQPETADYY